ncbi:MAG: glycosyltransferase family 4 protein [Planctomycetales bacterium]|nr:glycosyltransferase family 4 protein [Planctomycetales bacterium]
MASTPKVGYCLKVFPRFSQTFVLNELLAHQSAGAPVEIFSIRRPNDARYHRRLSDLHSDVSYLDPVAYDAGAFWDSFLTAAQSNSSLWNIIESEDSISHQVIANGVDLAARLKYRGIDHLHAHFGNVAAEVARIAAKIVGITYSMTLHARDIYHRDVNKTLLEKKIRDASFVATVSQFNVDHLAKAFPEHKHKIELVYNGLDLHELHSQSTDSNPSTNNTPLILGVGRLVEKKGFQYLIESCELLKASGKRFRCEIIGSGPLENELRAEITRRNLREHVVLSGSLTNENVLRKIQSADVVVLPCVIADDGDRDGLPTVMLEAMALETPCIATDVTGIPEVLVDERTGLSVPQRDAAQLARSCDSILNDSTLGRKLAANASAVVTEFFDLHRNCSGLRTLFREATAQRRNSNNSVRS